MIKVAVLGFGTVGGGVVDVMTENAAKIAMSAAERLEVKYILCRSDRPKSPFRDRIVHDFSIIENDPEVRIVAEVMGGVDAAYAYTKRALLAGKSVVTANKELVATYGHELIAIARERNLNYLFEASVGGGIPIIRPITQCLTANEIDEIYGVLNGTTNYILTQMNQYQSDYKTALREAQALGYAEADPTADVEGHDACRKICILADLCFGRHVMPEQVNTEGISGVTVSDIEYARRLGCKIKLLGRALRVGPDAITVYVEPHLIDKTSLLSNVDGVMNGIVVHGNAIGETMFYGPGAGRRPTASAVVADIIDAAKHLERRKYLDWGDGGDDYVVSPDDLIGRFYIRTASSLAEIGKTFGDRRLISYPGEYPGAGPGEYAFVTDPMLGHEAKLKARHLDVLSMFRILE